MDRTDALIRHFQFTGSASYGKIWYGTFYGEGVLRKLSLVMMLNLISEILFKIGKTAHLLKF